MADEPLAALKQLREALRSPISDIDDLVFRLSSALRAIDLHPSSVTSSTIGTQSGIIRAIEKHLPAIQTHLLLDVLPTFLPVLESSQIALVETFFSPFKRNSESIKVYRAVALVTYQNVIPLLSSVSQTTPLLISIRPLVLEILQKLSQAYSIDDLYWAVWTSVEKRDEVINLQWEEAVRNAVSLPAKALNAVGRWKNDRWQGDAPEELTPRPYLHRLVTKLENLTYELSQEPSVSDITTACLRFVFERLAAIGLLAATNTDIASNQPSVLGTLLPPLLQHLHPSSTSPLPPYPPTFLPKIFLDLPQNHFTSFVSSLLQHLSSRLIRPELPLEPKESDERIKRAALVLREIIGPAEVGSEAWDAVWRFVVSRKSGEIAKGRDHTLTRIIVAWIAVSRESVVSAFINLIVDAWTDPKYVKYALYTQQFHLTHTFILSISLLPQYHPFLISLSRSPKFLAALQSYLSHPDGSIRRLGMLVAEIISTQTIEDTVDNGMDMEVDDVEELKAGLEEEDEGKKRKPKPRTAKESKRLKFGKAIWDGSGDGREEARWLRSTFGVRDGDVQLSDSRDGKAWMLGWDSVPAEEADETNHLPQRTASQPKKDQILKEGGRSKAPKDPKPQPKIVMLSDEQMEDPLQGYSVPSPSSSRSPSPTPEYLQEIAADPSLALDGAQKKKVTRPVYIPQLLQLLKEREKPDHLEMAFKWGEGLIRAKRSFGTELSENAVNVATLAVALNDAFNLDDFEESRQGIMNALVACAPRQTTPFLAEQFFNNQYSLQQKFVILTAIAMGARELAGLSVPDPPKAMRRIDFPSKTLPPSLHRKYITPADPTPQIPFKQPDQLEQAIDGVRGLLLSKSAKKGEEDHPEIAREKRLKVGSSKRTLVSEVGSLAARQADQIARKSSQASHAPVIPFAEVAAEYFIMPLINRFWLHFQDISAREATAISTGNRFRGAGAGLVMSPMSLERLLMTLSILLHAGRHSSPFLAVLAPEALELAMTIGVRHPSRPEDSFVSPDLEREQVQESNIEAQVLGAALELCLVCLDGSVEQDKGRTLAMDKAELVLALGEWATGVFELESKGGMVSAGQGGKEGKIRATAAGVVVKIAEIGEKWGSLGLRG